MVLSIISLKAQTSDLTNTVRQLIATKYVLPPFSPTNYDVAQTPQIILDEVNFSYSSLNDYNLSQIYAIYYVIPTESYNAKVLCFTHTGWMRSQGIIKIYTNAYTGNKNHIKTTEYPINRWIW